MSTTWYVATPAGGGNDVNPGTQSQPFATLVHALTVAVAGDTILLFPGTYNENSVSGLLYFNTAYASTLTIGSTTGKAVDVIIQGSGTNAYSVKFGNGSNLTFNQITLASQNTSQTFTVGFTGGTSTNVTFNQCIFQAKGNGNTAVYCCYAEPNTAGASVNNLTYNGCIFTADNFVGTNVTAFYGPSTGTTTDTLHDITFNGCTVVNSNRGFYFTEGSPRTDKSIYNLTFTNNTITSLQTGNNPQGVGIELDNTVAGATLDTVNISGNVLNTNALSITLAGVTNLTCTGNYVVSTTLEGLVWGKNGGTGGNPNSGRVWNNQFYSTGSETVVLGGGCSSAVVFNGNTVQGHLGGLVIKDCPGVICYGNRLLGGVANAAMHLEGCTTAQVYNNYITSTANGTFGIWISYDVSFGVNPGGNFITNNTVVASGVGATCFNYMDGVHDAGGEVVDTNTYLTIGGATLGTINNNTVSNYAQMQTQWTAYGQPTNDSHSTISPGVTVSPSATRLAFVNADDTLDQIWMLKVLDAQANGTLQTLANLGMAVAPGKCYVVPSLVAGGYGMVVYLWDNGQAYVSILGTQTPLQLLAELAGSGLAPNIGGYGNIGAYYYFEMAILTPLLGQLFAGYKGQLFVGGHSLGGGTAQALYQWFSTLLGVTPMRIYTFGSPQVGDAAAQGALTGAVINFENLGDIMPSIPNGAAGLVFAPPLSQVPIGWNNYFFNAGPITVGYDGTLTPGHVQMSPFAIYATVGFQGFQPHFVTTYLERLTKTQTFPGNLTPFVRGYEKPWLIFNQEEYIPPGVVQGVTNPTAIPVPANFTNQMVLYKADHAGNASQLTVYPDPPPQQWTPTLQGEPVMQGCC